MGFLQDARAVWRTFVIFLTPVILVPLVLPGSSQESKCSYVLLVMAVYWVTESLPLAVTALLPVLMLPLLGIMPSKQVCQIYFKDVIFLLLGGLIVAIAIEESNLHKRFALKLLLLLGVQPRKLLLGFMVSTSFLSMWITNTATTAMMTPIARALLARLFKAQRQHRHQTRLMQDSE
ncbi:Na(+)/dicarboxylate cotransporter 3-like [Littorina saxatilis]|uniref:Na(+)/dicarboxylate cotransporter 3-like n=1 Tax=Littorina saxatilis TaxID=31220 RepID=UPI0038B63826